MKMKEITMEALSIVVLASFIGCANAESVAPAQVEMPAAGVPSENTDSTADKTQAVDLENIEPIAEKTDSTALQSNQIEVKPQQVVSPNAEKPKKTQATPQIGKKTETVRGRGLPKAFSGENQ
jgi:hypothetical protein